MGQEDDPFGQVVLFALPFGCRGYDFWVMLRNLFQDKWILLWFGSDRNIFETLYIQYPACFIFLLLDIWIYKNKKNMNHISFFNLLHLSIWAFVYEFCWTEQAMIHYGFIAFLPQGSQWSWALCPWRGCLPFQYCWPSS